MSLGKKLSHLRKTKKKGLRQEDVAKLIGVSRSALGMYEQGKRHPDFETLQTLANFYEVTTDYLLSQTDQPDGKVNQESPFDPLEEINKLVKKYGIEQMGFFDIDQWKKLTPHDIKMIEEHFKMIVKLAEEREAEDREG